MGSRKSASHIGLCKQRHDYRERDASHTDQNVAKLQLEASSVYYESYYHRRGQKCHQKACKYAEQATDHSDHNQYAVSVYRHKGLISEDRSGYVASLLSALLDKDREISRNRRNSECAPDKEHIHFTQIRLRIKRR